MNLTQKPTEINNLKIYIYIYKTKNSRIKCIKIGILGVVFTERDDICAEYISSIERV